MKRKRKTLSQRVAALERAMKRLLRPRPVLTSGTTAGSPTQISARWRLSA